MGQTSIELQWNDPEGDFDGFIVELKRDNSVVNRTLVDRSTKTVEIQDLQPDHRYTAVVYSLSSGQKSSGASTSVTTSEWLVALVDCGSDMCHLSVSMWVVQAVLSWAVQTVRFSFMLPQSINRLSLGYQGLPFILVGPSLVILPPCLWTSGVCAQGSVDNT